MSDFKIGDKVLVPATVTHVEWGGRFMDVQFSEGDPAGVPTEGITFAPYQDPDLRSGMVVAPLDETDDRSWWTQEGSAVDLWFIPVSIHDANRRRRHELPERIRVVWPT